MGRASSSTPRRESETGSHVSRKSAKSKRSATSSKSSPRDTPSSAPRAANVASTIKNVSCTTRVSRTYIDTKDRWKSKCGATCCEPVKGENLADYYLQPCETPYTICEPNAPKDSAVEYDSLEFDA